jgi:hypothetical protein
MAINSAMASGISEVDSPKVVLGMPLNDPGRLIVLKTKFENIYKRKYK